MQPFRKILVAADGSESSLHALREALRFALTEEIRLMAISVAPPYEGDLRLVGIKDIKAVLREPCERALNITAEVARTEGIAIEAVCAEGIPHEEIVNLAEAQGCDLIVMGTRGHSMEKLLLGSVTARVIGYSTVDVLAVPKSAKIASQSFLCATDGSKYGNMAADRALSLAKSYRAKLSFVTATNLPRETFADAPGLVEELIKKARTHLDEIKRRAEEMGIAARYHSREGEAHRALLDLAKEEDAQMIIMGSHGRTGLKRLLMGSVVEKVLGYSLCPVLIVKG